CAMMPIFRHLARGTVRATVVLSAEPRSAVLSNLSSSELRLSNIVSRNCSLPAIMSEHLVRLRPAVNGFLLLQRAATSVSCIAQLALQLIDPALLTSSSAK